MCDLLDAKREAVKKALIPFFEKKVMFSALDIQNYIRVHQIGPEDPYLDIGQLVRREFIIGGFPDGYVMQMVKSKTGKPFCVYRYSRAAKALDFSSVIRS